MGWLSDKPIRLRAAGDRSAIVGTADAAWAMVQDVGADRGRVQLAPCYQPPQPETMMSWVTLP